MLSSEIPLLFGGGEADVFVVVGALATDKACWAAAARRRRVTTMAFVVLLPVLMGERRASLDWHRLSLHMMSSLDRGGSISWVCWGFGVRFPQVILLALANLS